MATVLLGLYDNFANCRGNLQSYPNGLANLLMFRPEHTAF